MPRSSLPVKLTSACSPFDCLLFALTFFLLENPLAIFSTAPPLPIEMMLSARIKYNVKLPTEEKIQLKSLLRKGMINARIITRTRVLLLVDEGKKDAEIYQLL